MVLVDPISHNGNGSPRGDAFSPEEAVSALTQAPFPGLFSVSLFRKGDDLRTCLEKPLIIYGDSTLRGR